MPVGKFTRVPKKRLRIELVIKMAEKRIVSNSSSVSLGGADVRAAAAKLVEAVLRGEPFLAASIEPSQRRLVRRAVVRALRLHLFFNDVVSRFAKKTPDRRLQALLLVLCGECLFEKIDDGVPAHVLSAEWKRLSAAYSKPESQFGFKVLYYFIENRAALVQEFLTFTKFPEGLVGSLSWVSSLDDVSTSVSKKEAQRRAQARAVGALQEMLRDHPVETFELDSAQFCVFNDLIDFERYQPQSLASQLFCEQVAHRMMTLLKTSKRVRVVEIGSGKGTKTLSVLSRLQALLRHDRNGPMDARGVEWLAFDTDAKQVEIFESSTLPKIKKIDLDEFLDIQISVYCGAYNALDFSSAHGATIMPTVVLIDAPCSGLGTIRKHPEILARAFDYERIRALSVVQRSMLEEAAKTNGLDSIFYAVCTMTQAETEGARNANSARGSATLAEHLVQEVLFIPGAVPLQKGESIAMVSLVSHEAMELLDVSVNENLATRQGDRSTTDEDAPDRGVPASDPVIEDVSPLDAPWRSEGFYFCRYQF